MEHVVAALLLAEVLEREVRDHLVGVHVGRGAGAALDHVDDELIVELAARSMSSQAQDDRVGTLFVEHAELDVGARGSLLDAAQARRTRSGIAEIGVLVIGKFSSARAVCTPQ